MAARMVLKGAVVRVAELAGQKEHWKVEQRVVWMVERKVSDSDAKMAAWKVEGMVAWTVLSKVDDLAVLKVGRMAEKTAARLAVM